METTETEKAFRDYLEKINVKKFPYNFSYFLTSRYYIISIIVLCLLGVVFLGDLFYEQRSSRLTDWIFLICVLLFLIQGFGKDVMVKKIFLEKKDSEK